MEPWTAQSLPFSRYRFTNTSGAEQRAVVLVPIGRTVAQVEGAHERDPLVVGSNIEPGGTFIAAVRGGPGISINSTIPGRGTLAWVFHPS